MPLKKYPNIMDIYRQTVCEKINCGRIGKLYLSDKPGVFTVSRQSLTDAC